MKVAKEGNVPDAKDWEIVTLCSKKDKYDTEGCGAKLEEIREQDLVLMYFKGSHVNHYYSAVRCPRCGKYNRVGNTPETKLPQTIWERLDTDKNERAAIFDGFSDR